MLLDYKYISEVFFSSESFENKSDTLNVLLFK